MTRSILAWAFLFLLSGYARAQAAEPLHVHVNGVDLAYIEQGSGQPLILLHGGLGDYSSWQPQLQPLAERFRVIAYSRRYSYPNHNPSVPKDYSVATDVEDLAALIRSLDLHHVRLVGQSYGAFVALVFASGHPDVVHSLVLSEPPAHELVRGRPDGEAAYRDFVRNVWEPAGAAFRKDQTQQAMRVFMNGLAGADRFDSLPPEGREAAMKNAPSMRALALSSDPFGGVTSAQLRQLRVPSLIVTGEKTIALHKMVNAELARLLPDARQATIPGAGHGSARDNSPAFNQAALAFLKE